MSDMFGKALGIWKIETNDTDMELRPTISDVRKFRKIVLNENIKNNRPLMFEQFEVFLIDLIKREYPDKNKESIEKFVIFKCVDLLNEAMVTFGFTTKEELKKQKESISKETKNLIENV
jgi:hypothetical protein